MAEKKMKFVFCGYCKEEAEHRHMHDTAHGLAGTHMEGSERYECVKCHSAIFKKEGIEKGLKFILD